MRFQLLGPVAVHSDGATLALGPVKQRTLLVALLLQPDRVVPMDSLVAALWDGEPPASAVSNVRTYASRLRTLLVDRHRVRRVIGRQPGYLLRIDDDELDVTAFGNLARAGRSALAAGEPARAAKAFGDALALWHGDAAEDVFRSAYLGRRLTALAEARLAVVEEWIAARQQLREDAEIVAVLRRLTTAHPLRERLWCQLILSLYRVGDIGGALAGYQHARDLLVENLGVDPGPELTRLHQAILARDATLGGSGPYPSSEPATPVAVVLPPAQAVTGSAVTGGVWTAVPRELPADTVNLVGRSKELSAVIGTITERTAAPESLPAGRPAVISLHGPAGAGKSALAIRAATKLIPRFPDGQIYADLRATDGRRPDAAGILGRFLRALGVPDARVPADACEAAARFRSIAANRRLLIVLDNADDEAQVRPLITATSGSAVIVTSRRVLAALDCTARVDVTPLDATDAFEMLIDLCDPRLAETRHDELWQLAGLCDGLPLALRIIAARLTAAPDLPLAELAAELSDATARRALSCGDLTMTSP